MPYYNDAVYMEVRKAILKNGGFEQSQSDLVTIAVDATRLHDQRAARRRSK